MYLCKNLIQIHFVSQKRKEHFFAKHDCALEEMSQENILFTDELLNAIGVTEKYIDYFYKAFLNSYEEYRAFKETKDGGLKYNKDKFIAAANKMGAACSQIVTLHIIANHQLNYNEPNKHIWVTTRPDKWATPELQKYMVDYKPNRYCKGE